MIRRTLEPGIALDLKKEETYGGYLCLDALLSAQKPRTPGNHDELLFIIQHQTSELWMKLLVHELDAATLFVQTDDLGGCLKVLARVEKIQQVLFDQWGVLETLTPNEYLSFREALGQSSGFQSYQYRSIEFALGNKDREMLRSHTATPEVYAALESRLARPSLYDEFLRLLARRGFPVPTDRVQRDFTDPYEASEGVRRVFQKIYENTAAHWHEYDMCEKLVDLEGQFQLWRFRHMTTVKRIIGFRRGTGGSSGVGFLTRALEISFFPELWDVRTDLKIG